ncbi:hypothetical protein PC41400_21580 [Paenibacillus chitinolyticus]|uniref:Uncharacterized protein n=1 Tax=Paenibacillus chitinolyticus TaxID=79263 RepID=A0A410X0L6_9BACL|nr:hypothetical protein [Paenibacillus chitinolyticus]MCY9593720.1 hypothetical protein [Paenibacillus chitinolyticus]MCY9599714.1 hypothetical protein [Paenibacillus chitinolyticus]QAV20113.1 hypothetical protein PC41400_21580 [Paenibacillus chitinolyticus]
MPELNMNESMNIGPEIKLYEGCTKHLKIGTIKLIRQVRSMTKEIRYQFMYCIGRGVVEKDGVKTDFDAEEARYKEIFQLLVVEGLTDDEYEQIDENGLAELDGLLSRFL